MFVRAKKNTSGVALVAGGSGIVGHAVANSRHHARALVPEHAGSGERHVTVPGERVGVADPRRDDLHQRLTERRTESAEEIASRLAIAHTELASIRHFDYVLINEQAPPERRDSLPAVDDLEAIIHAERFRIHHYKDDYIRNVEES